jgi:hypothetical protein
MEIKNVVQILYVEKTNVVPKKVQVVLRVLNVTKEFVHNPVVMIFATLILKYVDPIH